MPRTILRATSAREIFVRNIVFGIEDSLVSTVGLLSGVAAAGAPRPAILLTGVVLITVEAFSMSVGSLVAEQSVEELRAHGDVPIRRAATGAMVMLVSYLIAGCIPLVPYVIASPAAAFPVSIILALTALAVVGAITAMRFHAHPLRLAGEMVVFGGFAIAIGVAAGRLVDWVAYT